MTEETSAAESREIGVNILSWIREMPDLEDLHKMIVSVAAVSTTDNKVELRKEDFDAIVEWAELVCQNLEMVALFHRGMLIARCGKEGGIEIEFSEQAAKMIEKSRQNDTDG